MGVGVDVVGGCVVCGWWVVVWVLDFLIVDVFWLI